MTRAAQAEKNQHVVEGYHTDTKSSLVYVTIILLFYETGHKTVRLLSEEYGFWPGEERDWSASEEGAQ